MLVFDVPGADGQQLVAVDKYKHVGGVTCVTGATTADARHKEQSAMTAYAPLAFSVFGNLIYDSV
eukprot:11188482-Karenia_brevis.AAC.1